MDGYRVGAGDLAVLHAALAALGIEVAEAEREAGEVGPTTRAALVRLQQLLGVAATGQVDETIIELARTALDRIDPLASGESLVEGVVYDVDGFPLPEVTVRAQRRELRGGIVLGQSRTDADGRYSITYPTPVPTKGAGVDIQLEVMGVDGTLLYRSPVEHRVGTKAEITLALGGSQRVGPPELARLREAVDRQLGTLRPEEIAEDNRNRDLSFLAGATGMDREQVALYAVAARMAVRTSLPVELFFALLRQNVPADAPVVVLADTADGVDLDANAKRLLETIFTASPEIRADAVDLSVITGIISPAYAKRAKEDLDRLEALATTAVRGAPLGTYKTSIGAILDAAAIPVPKQEVFLSRLTKSTGSEKFWAELAASGDFTAEEVATLRFAAVTGQLTQGHLPLVNRLLKARKTGPQKETRDLARLSAAQWRAILTDASAGPPVGPPANLSIDIYTRMLERNFERLHPTTAFSARLAEDTASPLPARTGVTRFLDTQPQFNLLRSDVDRYLKDHPTAIPAADRSAVRESLLTGQRVLKLAGRYAIARPLLADGIHSAQQIYAKGRTALVAAYSGHADIGPAQSARLYTAAEQTYAMALSHTMNLNAELAGISPAAIGAQPSAQAIGDDFPNLQSLFGSLDLCACKHCRSVLSPAAYLVDLLHFLAQRKAGGVSLKSILLARRPDLAQIELSCVNTNTVLPHIDLVNELLEDAVAPPPNPTAAARQRQTTLSSEVLGANPEHVNQNAYTKLAGAVFPWRLPFDLPLEEARAYLGMLGTDRVSLMRTFQPLIAPGSAQSTAVAIEGLGLSPVEADIVTAGPLAVARKSWEFWGLAENGNTVRDPVDQSIVVTGSWIEVLSRVRILLDRAGLAYQELVRLLNTMFVNPTGTVQLVNNPPDSCDLATMRVSGLTANVLDRMHRFVRLQRALGWDGYDTDTAVALLQAGTPEGLPRLNSVLLRQLCAVTTAMSRLRIPAPAAVALFARIDTREVPALPGDEPRHSLYTNLFANLAVLNPVDPAFTLNPARTEIAAIASNPKLHDHRPALVAAFEVADDELALAIDTVTNGILSLANLSTVYRHVLLARGLGLSIRELLSLLAIVERRTATAPFAERVNPFDIARPESLALFCGEAERIGASAFTIAELDYLLRHVFDTTSGVAPDDVGVGTLLRSIREKLAKLAVEYAASADPTGALVRRSLAAALPPADVDRLMAMLAGTSRQPESDQRALITTNLAKYLDVPAALTTLVGSGALPAGPARYEYVLARLLAHTLKELGTSLVIQELSDALGLPTELVADLVTSWFPGFANKSEPLVAELLALPAIARDPVVEDNPISRTEPGFAGYFAAFANLAKVAMVVTGFGFTATEARWLRPFGVAEGWLDLTALPQTPTADAGGRYARWVRLAGAAQAKAALGVDGTPFTALLDLARSGVSKQVYLQALTARTGWTAPNLRVLAGEPMNPADSGLLGLSYPDDYRTEVAITRLAPAFELLGRLGIGPNVSGWIGATVTPDQARAIKQSAKGKYSARQWPQVARPVRDALRERQRDALLGYLLAHPPAGVHRWHDANDVYARYLIDVEMGAGQDTSRIVQATASVQLFVQRCLLNLEPGIVVDAELDGDWLQWQWMNRYRVWEANRKVFLYPENWVSPTLRRDKSPFFQDFENELLQTEVTKDTAADAFRGYLEKLNTVARLDVVGVYQEYGTPNRLHVVARKPGRPATYYHRMWIDSARWTAWTKIDLDITSDHVLPLVWKGRLHLFWVGMTVKPQRVQADPPPMQLSSSPPAQTRYYMEMKLQWSEFKNNKWLPTESAPHIMFMAWANNPAQFTLRSAGSMSDELHLNVFSNGTHFGQFVLGGVGKPVEAFRYYNGSENFNVISYDAAEVGRMPQSRYLGYASIPSNSRYDGQSLMPASETQYSANRLRVSPMNAAYYNANGHLLSVKVLDKADRYRLTVPHQRFRLDSTIPFFYADSNRQYFVIPVNHYWLEYYYVTTTPPLDEYGYPVPVDVVLYQFEPFYHPYVPLFLRELNRGGVDALFDRRLQLNPAGMAGTLAFDFNSYYKPTMTTFPLPVEGVDFGHNAGYAIYNWELFFHAPFQIGESLSRNQRFAEAKQWYEYIFNPTSTTNEPAPRRYWVTKPFNLMTANDYWAQTIQNLMSLIHQRDPVAEHQVALWRANPFDPHVIAGLRPVAYQRAIVMKYIDNLIAWGDHLFRQDTLESVNEATQLYVLAAELLGPRPEIVPRKEDGPAKTYSEIESTLDDFSNAITAAENLLAPAQASFPVDLTTPQLPIFRGYFAIPPNEQLLRYWDVVADRLFAIRHGYNIDGVARQLALFAPPIDPGLLVKATAAGLDLASVASDTGAALPPYRFRVILREAIELAELVRDLGTQLLTCLEKRDTDGLERLHASAEVTLQNRIHGVHTKTVEEADQQIRVVAKSKELVTVRRDYYAGLKDELMNTWEAVSMLLNGGSLLAHLVAVGLDIAAGVAHVVPEAQFGLSGVGGTPHATIRFGGSNVGHAATAWGTVAKTAAAMLQTGAQMSTTMAQYQRRRDEWRLQHNLANKELEQLDAQEVAVEIRQEIAKRERDNHEVVIDNAKAVRDYLQDRFTSAELYEWMITQTSATYFQAYQLAYNVAQRAELCLRHELGLRDSSFIQFGYWDSLKQGLLSADRMLYDLRRMEAAYHTDNVRELELTKHVSLLNLDPYALVQLRNTGECTVRLPELLFDLDNPGHYLRRIKNVGISVPCVTGPYGGVSMSLTLLENSTRVVTDTAPQYARLDGEDPRFVDRLGGAATIVTSSGRNDTGVFEPRLDDERYLPFEGAGAISTWRLRLNPVLPQFDYRTITDVVLHLQFTAREGGAAMTAAASASVKAHLNDVALAQSRTGLYRLISARQEHGTAWTRFLHPGSGQDQLLTIPTPADDFPFYTNGMALTVTGIDVLAMLSNPGAYELVLTRPGAAAQTLTMLADTTLGGLHHLSTDLAPGSPLGRAPSPEPYPQWTVKLRRQGASDFRSLSEKDIEDLVLILRYEVQP